jgi:hypothetical protein
MFLCMCVSLFSSLFSICLELLKALFSLFCLSASSFSKHCMSIYFSNFCLSVYNFFKLCLSIFPLKAARMFLCLSVYFSHFCLSAYSFFKLCLSIYLTFVSQPPAFFFLPQWLGSPWHDVHPEVFQM